MNVNKFTLFILSLLIVTGVTAQSTTFKYSLYGGKVNIMGDMLDIPDLGHWHYFSFETGTVIGTSEAIIENVNAGNIGSEKIDAEWAARTDWDIAFHSTDIRTNGGATIKIADSKTEENLDVVFANLTQAPQDGYIADETLSGTFIFAMQSMPPLRTAQLSACGATNGWATFGMGSSDTNPTIVVFKTITGKYIKVYLKKFYGEGTEESPAVGDLEMVYEVLSSGSGIGHSKEDTNMAYVLNGVLYTHNSTSNANVEIYNLAGTLLKTANTPSVSVSDITKGVYIVKTEAEGKNRTQKIVIR